MAKKNLLQLISFEDKSIRRVWYDGEWYFTIVDVVAACSDSKDPSGYLKDMRRRDPELAKGWGQIATPLKVPTKGGIQTLNCANTEGCLRTIQSIPSPKAEPFKRWLAKVGRERLEESENPQLGLDRAMERAIEEYKIRGRDPFSENAAAAKKGGQYAGKALDTFEKESGMKVVSENNFLEEDKKARKKLSAFRKKKEKDDNME